MKPKHLLLTALLLPRLTSAADLMRPGLYTTDDGTYEYCPQQVEVETYSNGDVALQVTYGGDCGDDGPYYYPCEDNTCRMGAISFQWKNENEYLWSNQTYDGIPLQAVFRFQR